MSSAASIEWTWNEKLKRHEGRKHGRLLTISINPGGNYSLFAWREEKNSIRVGLFASPEAAKYCAEKIPEQWDFGKAAAKQPPFAFSDASKTRPPEGQ